jgi:NTE family protein
MRRIITIIFVLSINCLGIGQDTLSRMDSIKLLNQRPKIGLALSGGAAHGLAHIGVIQYLEEIGIDIDYVTGTSMGAIIGALYAMGYDSKKIEQIAKELDWEGILNNEIPLHRVAAVEKLYYDKYPLTFVIDNNRILLPQAFLNTNKLEMEFAKLFAPASNIEDFSKLPRPFQCFGVDIEKGEVVSLTNGRLAKALRASMAIPSVFAPKFYQGRYLVDGGLMRNFPVEENFAMGADFVIGSYVGREKADISQLRSLLDILTESAFMMSIADSRIQKELVDVLLVPDVKSMGVFGFSDYEIFINKGYEAAKSNEVKLKELAQLLGKFPKEKTESLEDPGFVFIDSIKINDIPESDKDLVKDKLALTERSYMSFVQIENGINRVSSTLNFESVHYDVVKNGSEHYLVIEAIPREVKKIGINLNHYSATNSSLIINGQIRNFLIRLSSFRASLRLSENAAIGGEYFLRGGFNNKNWIIGTRIEVQRYDMIFESFARQKKNGFMWEGYITPYLTYEFNSHTSLRAEFNFRRFDFTNQLRSEIDIRRYIENGSKIGVILNIDNRDARVFTKEGMHTYFSFGHGFVNDLDIKYTMPDAAESLEVLIADDFIEGEFFISQTFPLAQKVWWTFSGNAYFKSNPSLLDNYTIGGTTFEGNRNLPFIGFREQELRMDQHLYARTDIRIGLFDNVSVSIIGNVLVGESKVFRYSDSKRDHTLTAYGVGFEFGIMLPVGPVLFDIGYSSEAKSVRTELSIGWKHFF